MQVDGLCLKHGSSPARSNGRSTVRPRESWKPACSSFLGTKLAAVVPAKAGTHNHQGFGYHWPCHIALLRRMGPRLCGDDSGESLLHIFESGDTSSECSDQGSSLPSQIHFDHALVGRHLIDRALGDHGAFVQAGDLDAEIAYEGHVVL